MAMDEIPAINPLPRPNLRSPAGRTEAPREAGATRDAWAAAKAVLFFCAALAAVSASGLIATPLVNTGVSSRAQVQDVLGNYAFKYDIVDGATGSLNSRAEVGKVGIAAAPIAVAAPHIAAPLALAGGVYGYGAPLAAAAPLAYGGVLGHGVAPLAYGGVLGHGGALGLGYGAGIYGAGIGKLI
ncbi:uncharacterized protein TNIN_41071 [Trichonephila inaurata madagascariensis]|uniref:Uncharacterized protein n=1 Tax=Trichonephila inaurata madagascariensis TaxID=2747483 RepID=A0A8X6IPA6_9ARAC|nr:uncharacterized protein TNIN_41071 [Trichonephila inaurata madagascariensis]